MVIVHKQVGDMSLTEVDFGDHMPSDEEVRRVRDILGIRPDSDQQEGERSREE